jgi:CheY-like chemotaxis protein
MLTQTARHSSSKGGRTDDEPHSLRYETTVAASGGWNVTFADTAARAVELLDTRQFRLVLLDLILPRDDYNKERGLTDPDVGIHLLRSIRARQASSPTPPTVRVLVVSCVVSEDICAIAGASLIDAHDFLRKPLFADFAKTVDRVTQELEQACS